MPIDGASPEKQHVLRDKVTQILLRLADQGISDKDALLAKTLAEIGTLKRNGFPFLVAAVLAI